LIWVGLAAVGSVSCGDVVRQGRSPVFLIMDKLEGSSGGLKNGTPSGTLLSDVAVVSDPCSASSPCIFDDPGQVQLRLAPKDVTTAGSALAPTTNSDVTITRYHIAYRRADGRNTQGVDVPYAFDGAVTGTVSFGGTLALSFVLVRHVAKEESPLAQLTTNRTVITTIADVTFYGRDQVGNDISVTGSIQIDFGNFADQT
jgi:hypothetical protein